MLGGGCFWCLEAILKVALKKEGAGIFNITSGYAGGDSSTANYKDVCQGNTGHAEVCLLDFDPKLFSYSKILEIFWDAHDPSTLNRQGNDIGEQYRSVIFYTTEEQKNLALKSIKNLEDSKRLSAKIVTQILPLQENKFYPAEKEHQNYFENNPDNPYCLYVIRPKLKRN